MLTLAYLNDSFCKVNPSNVVEYDDMLGIKGLPIYTNNKIWKINYKLPEFLIILWSEYIPAIFIELGGEKFS